MVASVKAQWRIDSQSKIQSLGHGASFVEKSVNGPENAKLSLVFFDESACELRILTQAGPQKTAKPIAMILQATGAIAGVNGGYFDPQAFLPSAMEIESGRVTGLLETKHPFEGSLVVLDGKAQLLWSSELKEVRGITQMVQCSPALVSGGMAVKGLGNATTPVFPRTFIATDSKGRWVMGVCRRLALSGLVSMLASHQVITEFRIDRALNLDGGPSSGLWCRDASGTEHEDKEGTRVRNMVAVFPRQ